MQLIEIEILLNFIASCLALIGLVTYMVNAVFVPLLLASLICVIAGKWVEIADRIEFKEEG